MTAPTNTPNSPKTDTKGPSGTVVVEHNGGEPAANASSPPANADKNKQGNGNNKKNDRSQHDSRAAVVGTAPASPPRHGEANKNEKTEMNDKNDKKDALGVAPRDEMGIDRMANESNTFKPASPTARPGE